MPDPGRAYPRSRGATDFAREYLKLPKGLSPLARGNLQAQRVRVERLGPIPARAGQPPRRWARLPGCGAYPRSRGATIAVNLRTALKMGLSPLARGNRNTGAIRANRGGPIPARAGQPYQRGAHVVGIGAYPRSRGATGWFDGIAAEGEGLSRLARGNRWRSGQALALPGPIPARAGQPHRTIPRCRT